MRKRKKVRSTRLHKAVFPQVWHAPVLKGLPLTAEDEQAQAQEAEVSFQAKPTKCIVCLEPYNTDCPNMQEASAPQVMMAVDNFLGVSSAIFLAPWLSLSKRTHRLSCSDG